MDDRSLARAKARAKELNLPGWQTIQVSKQMNKRFSVRSPSGKLINFGQWPFERKGTFIDHGDEEIRKNWRARHFTRGNPEDPETALYWSSKVLW